MADFKIGRTSVNNLKNMTDSTSLLPTLALTKKVDSPEGELTIVNDVSLSVKRGDTAAVVGPSGAGKATLLARLAGLDEPTSGQVWLGEEELTALDEDGRAQLRNRRVGFVFQSFHLLPSLTALENVLLPLELSGIDHEAVRARTALHKVGLETRLHHYPRQLSGGEKQRVAIARAFASNPSVLFADEPTGNLDSKTGENIIETMFSLNKLSSTTLILVTHEKRLAKMCDREICLDAGKLSSNSEH